MAIFPRQKSSRRCRNGPKATPGISNTVANAAVARLRSERGRASKRVRYPPRVRDQLYFFLAFLVGNPLRFVPAISLSSLCAHRFGHSL